ncbi:MAG TPA: hypothetical protein VE631_10535, partial [Alphaproteobacteria bacterium]|nr:hypothetical protein [Alphaproteobacteria bacterium]
MLTAAGRHTLKRLRLLIGVGTLTASWQTRFQGGEFSVPRRIARLVRGLPEIGVANQDPDTARRIRTINVIAAIACVLTAAYCAVYAVYDLPLFRDEVIFLLFVVPSYALILLVSRA